MKMIYKSHNLNILKNQIIDHLESEHHADPLYGQTIIVPNLDTARWLKLQIAEKTGIAANLKFILPSEWQWNQIRKLYPGLPHLLPSDPEPMRWSLFDLLSDARFRENFPVLKSYVNEHSTGQAEAAVSELSKQIASVFDQYLIYRPQMLLNWQQNKIPDKEEKWQAELWKQLNKRWKSNFKDIVALNKAELYRDVSGALKNGKIKAEDILFVFNPGLIPAPVLELLKIAGQQSKLKIYLMQPAPELQNENRNELLSAFGNESVRVSNLFDIEDAVSEDLFHTDSADRTLQKIQKKIVENRPLDSPLNDTVPQDIQIRSCHSPSREVEVLYHFLLEKFEENEDLNPEDILVVTPDLEKYQPAIDAVFGTSEEGLPEIAYYVGLRSANDEQGIERAFLKLLDIADSRFDYTGVMDLFGTEPVRNTFSVTESEERTLRNWLDSNHVIWGASSEHREEWGQPPESLNTWRTAQSRIWMGQAAADDSGQIADDLILFKGLDTGREKEIWASFSSYLETLNEIRTETSSKRKVQSWCKLIEHWVDRLIIDKSTEYTVAQYIKRIINNIYKGAEVAGNSVPVSFSMIREQLKSGIKASSAGSSSFTRGVLFTSMVPLRSIPFKIIALIGINDGSFPRKQNSPLFDLIAKHPKPSDRNRKDEDRNLFLESILSAGEVHYCSYIGQDPVDNEELAQSPVISEWADYIAKVCGHKPDQVVKKEALTSFSPSNFDSNRKNYSGLFRNTSKKLLESDHPVSGLFFGKIENGSEAEQQIRLDDLTSFFYNPVRHFLKSKFEIALKGTEEENDEFSLDTLQYHMQFARVFGWKLAGKPDQEIFDLLVQSGELPSGWPGKKKLNETLKLVQDAVNTLHESEVQPVIHQLEVDIDLKQISIKGLIKSYSDKYLLDISVSSKSGKILLAHWVKHLCVSVADKNSGDSFLLCDLKKKPLWLRFRKPENSGELLEKAVELFRQTSEEPKLWFPGASYAFEKNKKDGEGDAGKARVEFEGSEYSFAERDDLYIKHLLGENVRFDESWVKNEFQDFVSSMADHIEEM